MNGKTFLDEKSDKGMALIPLYEALGFIISKERHWGGLHEVIAMPSGWQRINGKRPDDPSGFKIIDDTGRTRVVKHNGITKLWCFYRLYNDFTRAPYGGGEYTKMWFVDIYDKTVWQESISHEFVIAGLPIEQDKLHREGQLMRSMRKHISRRALEVLPDYLNPLAYW